MNKDNQQNQQNQNSFSPTNLHHAFLKDKEEKEQQRKEEDKVISQHN